MPWRDPEVRRQKQAEGNRRRYAAGMAEIRKKLGDACALCGRTDVLHIDHVNGRPYVARRLSSNCRLKRYRQEATEGKLRLLCESCNCSSKNHPPGCTCGRSPNQPHPEPAPAPQEAQNGF